MEIKDILSELITVANNAMNERGCPENFDLEDFISVIEDYYSELDEIGEFVYLDDEDGYDFSDDDDDYYRGQD
jgi:pantothenate kinase